MIESKTLKHEKALTKLRYLVLDSELLAREFNVLLLFITVGESAFLASRS